MARRCAVTGKGVQVGHNVSHANNKTKRRFLPNLQYRRFWVETENRWVSMRVSNAGLRTIDKKGIDVVRSYRAKGHDINWMNLGGGFGISYRQNEGPPAQAYADVIVPGNGWLMSRARITWAMCSQ